MKRLFVKKLKIWYSSDHPILIKFHQLVVNIAIKELQIVFLTFTVINSNGNMKELERKIKCENLMLRWGISYCANADVGSLKCHL